MLAPADHFRQLTSRSGPHDNKFAFVCIDESVFPDIVKRRCCPTLARVADGQCSSAWLKARRTASRLTSAIGQISKKNNWS